MKIRLDITKTEREILEEVLKAQHLHENKQIRVSCERLKKKLNAAWLNANSSKRK